MYTKCWIDIKDVAARYANPGFALAQQDGRAHIAPAWLRESREEKRAE